MKSDSKGGLEQIDSINSKKSDDSIISEGTKNFDFYHLDRFLNNSTNNAIKNRKNIFKLNSKNKTIKKEQKGKNYFILNGYHNQKQLDKDYVKLKYFSLQKNFLIPLENENVIKNEENGQNKETDELISNSSSSSYEKLSKVFGFDSSLSKTARRNDLILSDSIEDPELERSILSIEKKHLEFIREEEIEIEADRNKINQQNIEKEKKVSFFSTQESKKIIEQETHPKISKSKAEKFTTKLKNTGSYIFPFRPRFPKLPEN